MLNLSEVGVSTSEGRGDDWMSANLNQWLNQIQDEIIAIPTWEHTLRYRCGKCGNLIKSKDADYSDCRRCGTRSRIIR
jgi:DNA-directed RNA polymerase subunit RPC12/RpoP